MERRRTNTTLVEGIKKYILEDEDREEAVAELKRYKKSLRPSQIIIGIDMAISCHIIAR